MHLGEDESFPQVSYDYRGWILTEPYPRPKIFTEVYHP